MCGGFFFFMDEGSIIFDESIIVYLASMSGISSSIRLCITNRDLVISSLMRRRGIESFILHCIMRISIVKCDYREGVGETKKAQGINSIS